MVHGEIELLHSSRSIGYRVTIYPFKCKLSLFGVKKNILVFRGRNTYFPRKKIFYANNKYFGQEMISRELWFLSKNRK